MKKLVISVLSLSFCLAAICKTNTETNWTNSGSIYNKPEGNRPSICYLENNKVLVTFEHNKQISYKFGEIDRSTGKIKLSEAINSGLYGEMNSTTAIAGNKVAISFTRNKQLFSVVGNLIENRIEWGKEEKVSNYGFYPAITQINDTTVALVYLHTTLQSEPEFDFMAYRVGKIENDRVLWKDAHEVPVDDGSSGFPAIAKLKDGKVIITFSVEYNNSLLGVFSRIGELSGDKLNLGKQIASKEKVNWSKIAAVSENQVAMIWSSGPDEALYSKTGYIKSNNEINWQDSSQKDIIDSVVCFGGKSIASIGDNQLIAVFDDSDAGGNSYFTKVHQTL